MLNVLMNHGHIWVVFILSRDNTMHGVVDIRESLF